MIAYQNIKINCDQKHFIGLGWSCSKDRLENVQILIFLVEKSTRICWFKVDRWCLILWNCQYTFLCSYGPESNGLSYSKLHSHYSCLAFYFCWQQVPRYSCFHLIFVSSTVSMIRPLFNIFFDRSFPRNLLKSFEDWTFD